MKLLERFRTPTAKDEMKLVVPDRPATPVDSDVAAASVQPTDVGTYTVPAALEVMPEPADDATGVYGVIRNTNYWFNRELYEIEQLARKNAAEWAEKGLPHHATERNEPLPVESALASRCMETFRAWIERVRTKMQDEIESAGQGVAGSMVSLRFHIRQLESTQEELKDRRAELDHRRRTADPAKPFGYRSMLGKHRAFFLLALLTFVEFAANFPLFRLLLPMNAALGRAAEAMTERATDKGIWTGWYHWFQDLMLRPEALAVSFVVVAVIVLLSEVLGDSLRPLIALKAGENPAAASGIARHQAQHGVRLAVSIFGIVFALGFLFIARDRVPATAIERVRADSEAVARADIELSAAQRSKSVRVGELANKVEDARHSLEVRQDEAAYARTVQSSNKSILMLNIGLVIAAAVLGYSKKEEELCDHLSPDPDLLELESKVRELSQTMLEQKQRVRETIAAVRVGISRVHHLLAARPLEESEAKAKRLNGVIPQFRSENARLRSLDPGEVLAFRSDPTISFPFVEDVPYRAPAGFDGFADEFDELVKEFGRLSRETVTPSLGIVA